MFFLGTDRALAAYPSFMVHRSFLAVALTSAVLAVGCSSIPVKMHTESHIQHMDGTVEHKSSNWEGTLDQLPAQLGKAGQELGDVTAVMVKELTDVPPPGHVELKDLDPSLAKYQGKQGLDFLMSARDADGTAADFRYVRLGVASYDDFFKAAQELHALVHQATQTIGQLRQLAAKVQGKDLDPKANLKAEVDAALGKGEHEARLRQLVEVGASLGVLLPQVAAKLAKLVTTGQALVTQAATSLTNPKVLAHLDLVKKGLVSSVAVVKASGDVVVAFGKDLSGLGHQG
jgi:hypothetical protein